NHVGVADGVADADLGVDLLENRHLDRIERIDASRTPIRPAIRPGESFLLLKKSLPSERNQYETIECLIEYRELGHFGNRVHDVLGRKARITRGLEKKTFVSQRIESMRWTTGIDDRNRVVGRTPDRGDVAKSAVERDPVESDGFLGESDGHFTYPLPPQTT